MAEGAIQISTASPEYIKKQHQYIKKTWFNFLNLLEIIKLDKKNTGHINMVLLTDNEPIIVKIENLEILNQSINEVIRLCDTVS
jgi:hypothetical protein